MNVAFPYAIDRLGLTDSASSANHIRQMIEQVLFTAPGERVNQPSFGCDVRRLIFSSCRDELATALEATIQGSLQQWLGDVISIRSVDVVTDQESLAVTVSYVELASQEPRLARFTS